MKRLIEDAWNQFAIESLSGENEITLRALRKIFFKGAIAMYEINLAWKENVWITDISDLNDEILEFLESLPKDVVQ